VSASLFTPRKIAARDCSPMVICFAIIFVSTPEPGLSRVSVLKEIKCKDYRRCYQQEMNQAGGDKATIKSD
jgi:hypothetical protein